MATAGGIAEVQNIIDDDDDELKKDVIYDWMSKLLYVKMS